MYLLLTSLIIVLIIILLYSSYNEYYAEYLNYKSKCFSCEKQVIDMYGINSAWKANPAKSYNSEQNGILQANGNISGGFLGKTMKFY